MKKEKEIPELERLKEFKKKSGWTYEKIAEFMKVHSQSVCNWITGAFKPSNMAIEKIRKFLDTFFIQ